MITMEQFTEMKDAMNVAQNDDTPFVNATDDEMHIFGDPNKTEVVSNDYVVRFAFPDQPKWRSRIKTTGDKLSEKQVDGYLCVERVYKDAFISPRMMGNAITAMALLEQFLYEVTEEGEVKSLSDEQIKSVLYTMNHEISDATYELVGAVLRIPLDEIEWMLPLNTFENAVQIVLNNPSVVNESDLFFG